MKFRDAAHKVIDSVQINHDFLGVFQCMGDSFTTYCLFLEAELVYSQLLIDVLTT